MRVTGERTLAVLAGLFWCGSVHGAPPTVDQAAALAEQARPHLEAVLGARVDPWPRCRLATPTERKDWQREELSQQLRWQFPDLDAEAFRRTLPAVQDAAQRVAVARYHPASGEILLIPENLDAIARWDEGLARVRTPAFLQLAIVHELARCALDRRYHLTRRQVACRDAEEYLALQALVEGRAQWVTRAVAGRLGTEAIFPLWCQRFIHLPDTATDPALRSASQEVLRQQCYAAFSGQEFYAALEANGVRDAERQVFTRPVCPLSWIERPERFMQAVRTQRPELAAVLAGVEAPAGAAGWVTSQEPWTAVMVRQIADLFGERARCVPVVHSWSEGRLRVWTAKENLAHQVALGLARFDDVAGAKRYVAFTADLQRKQDTKWGAEDSPFRILETHTKAITIAGADEAMWVERKMQFSGATNSVAVTMLTVRLGDAVMEITWRDVLPDLSWGERAVDQILRAASMTSAR